MYGAEGGEQYDYYTIERDYDEGYMNARVPNLKTNRLFEPLYYNQYNMMRDMSDRISTAFHPNAEVREQSGYGTREKQRDAIFNGLKSWNEQMIEDLNGVKRSIDMELGDRKFEAEGEGMSLKESAKVGFGLGAGLLGFRIVALTGAVALGALLNRG